MIKIFKDILDQNATNVPNKKMTPKYITVHNTGNTSKGANAEMHAKYQQNGSGGRKASWHYTVDDSEIWQTLEDNQQGWHAGDGNGPGNTQSIGIEICENRDGNFGKAVKNAQNLISRLIKKHNIPIDNIVPHKHWSGKNCPRQLLDDWDGFIKGINADVKEKTQPKNESKVKSKTVKKLAVDGSWGPATTSALQRHFKELGYNIIVDGIISGQPNNRSTRNIPSAKFGAGGSMLIRAMQRYYKSGIVDGKISGTSKLITAMQRKYNLRIVDGYVSMPSNLVKEVQRRLNNGSL